MKPPARMDLSLDELMAILDRAAPALSAPDAQRLRAALDTLAWLTGELERKDTSLARLRQILFGPTTESTSRVLGAAAAAPEGGGKGSRKGSRPKRKGHGRHGAAAYLGARRVEVAHATLAPGHSCPDCERGKLYAQTQPAKLVRVQGVAPLGATVWELARLRCNLCGKVYTAPAPQEVGPEKYDATAASMIGLLKYGSGLPFHRLERLESSLGIPLPAASQWEVVQRAAGWLAPAYAELVRQAAQGEVLYNDDTTMKILGLSVPSRDEPEAPQGDEPDAPQGDEPEPTRTGVFTTGIVSTTQQHKIALFFTGRQHAGENLADVLAQRAEELAAPIQMCDALSRNIPQDPIETMLAHCIAHARRRFVEVAANFPEDCRHVLETLGEVYHIDAEARRQELSPQDRLRFHQEHSEPLLEKLKSRFVDQLNEHTVEPNSGLGEAIGYALKHWQELTLFLRVPGAPLDNSVCERALKKAILHRKNSLFYKTQNGARVGDVFMSLIYTAELCQANPFDYLVALQQHGEAVSSDAAAWMPWNFAAALARLAAATVSPSG